MCRLPSCERAACVLYLQCFVVYVVPLDLVRVCVFGSVYTQNGNLTDVLSMDECIMYCEDLIMQACIC